MVALPVAPRKSGRRTACRLHIYSQAIASSPPLCCSARSRWAATPHEPARTAQRLTCSSGTPRESAYDAYAALVARLRSVMPVESPIDLEELLAGHLVEAVVHTLSLPVGGRAAVAARLLGLKG